MTADIRDRIDPQVRARLDAYLAVVGPQGLSGIEDIPARRARQAELTAGVARPNRPEGMAVADHVVPAEGARPPVPVRVHTPRGVTRPAPCVYHVHGGGLVSGSVDGDEGKAAALAEETDCVVVSVDYRLAPEHPYPAAFDDCLAGLEWLAANSAGLGIDGARVAVHGSSAGGCLAVAVALHVRDHGGPPIAVLVLVSPMLDDRPGSPSHRTNTGFGAWSREANEQAWRAYLGEVAGTDAVPAYAAPARAHDVGGLPPTFVETGEVDLFRDEDVAFAQRLMHAGVPVELHVHPGAVHGGESVAPSADVTLRARSIRLASLARALGTPSQPGSVS